VVPIAVSLKSEGENGIIFLSISRVFAVILAFGPLCRVIRFAGGEGADEIHK